MRKASGRRGHLRRDFFTASAFALLLLATLVSIALAQDVYVANLEPSTVSVIDTQTNRVVGSPIRVGQIPFAIAITP